MPELTIIESDDTRLRGTFLLPEVSRDSNTYDLNLMKNMQRVVTLAGALLTAGVSVEEILRRLHSPGMVSNG